MEFTRSQMTEVSHKFGYLHSTGAIRRLQQGTCNETEWLNLIAGQIDLLCGIMVPEEKIREMCQISGIKYTPANFALTLDPEDEAEPRFMGLMPSNAHELQQFVDRRIIDLLRQIETAATSRRAS